MMLEVSFALFLSSSPTLILLWIFSFELCMSVLVPYELNLPFSCLTFHLTCSTCIAVAIPTLCLCPESAVPTITTIACGSPSPPLTPPQRVVTNTATTPLRSLD
ncbi:hypothetical protein V8F06_012345 [Rhypophila decipiens]